jgi:ABC-type bacteriocin/lantibiotic exporter with double-glycine peptidase domain
MSIIFAFLMPLIRNNLKQVLLGCALLIVFSFFVYLYKDYTTTKSNNKVLEQVNASLEATLKETIAHNKNTIKALQSANKRNKQAREVYDDNNKEIEKYGKDGDGDLAPVLRNQLERMRIQNGI